MPLHHQKPVFYRKSTKPASYIYILGKYVVYLIIVIGGLRLIFSLLGHYSPLVLLDIDCVDKDKNCHSYVKSGACSSRQEWMYINCAKSCKSCEYANPHKRCNRKRLNISDKPLFGPDDMNKMLASLEQRLSDKNEVKVLSAAPYIITIDNFLSDKEIDSVLSSLTGWEVPKLKGGDPDEEENLDVHKARAPYVDWCDDKCLESEGMKSFFKKVEHAFLVPRTNLQPHPLLKFRKGQEMYEHIDADEDEGVLPCGPRIMSLIVYLQAPEFGGEIEFPELKLKVELKKGRALLYQNVDGNDPSFTTIDYNSINSDLPVVEGTKIILKYFVHPYNFMESQKWDCVSHHSEM